MHYQDSHAPRTYHSESPDGPGQQQHDVMNREQPVPSYPGPGPTSYDQQSTPGNTFYGALGGNQTYGDGYGVSSSSAQDRSRKHKHGSKSKGKSRVEADPYAGGGSDSRSLAYNVPQLSSDRSSQGDYYQNYSHYPSGSGQSYGPGSYAGQSGYGEQFAPGQGQSPSM